MRWLSLWVAASWLGCGLAHPRVNYKLGEPMLTRVGEPMVYYESAGRVIGEELIYTGHEGQAIHALYREYARSSETSGILARPAFYQEVVYDLESGATIVFRSYRIQVIEFNNEAIRFVVLSDEGRSEAATKAPKERKAPAVPTGPEVNPQP